MRRNYFRIFYFISALVGMILIVSTLLFGEWLIFDYIISIASILVTVFLGIATYGQTKEQIFQDKLDKIPYFTISNLMEFKEIDQEKFHVGSGQYAFTPRLRFVIGSASDSALIFKIVLKDVTNSNISKVNIYFSDKKIASYKELKKLPASEMLNKIIRNANNKIAMFEKMGMNCDEIIVARDETKRIIKELNQLQTPDIYSCNSEEIYEIEMLTYLENKQEISKYMNDYCPIPYYIVIDMETIQGYRYTQIVYINVRYSNIYSKDENSTLEVVFSVQDFDSKILPIELEKINWNRDFYNGKMKTVAKKICGSVKE